MADSGLFIDGQSYTTDDLTYREQRDMREKLKENGVEDIDQASELDFIPAFIWVVKRRSDESFAFEQALEFKPTDLVAPKSRPTKQGKS